MTTNRLGLLLAGLTFMSACAGAEDGSATQVAQSSDALAEVKLAGGRTVTFHDIGAAVVVREVTALGTPSLLEAYAEQQFSAEEIYDALLPETEAPEALQQAFERAAKVRAASHEGVSLEKAADAVEATVLRTEGEGRVGVVRQAVTSSQFLNSGACEFYPPRSVFRVCRTDRVGNGYWAYANSTTAWFVVGSAQGGVNAQLSFDNGSANWNNYVASTKQLTIVSTMSDRSRPRQRIDITQASGDTFHVAGVWYNE